MRSLSEKINEALFFPNTGYDECDEITREYGNLFGMFSNTLLRKTPFGCYVLTGSALRSGVDFLWTPQFNAEGKTASQWFNKYGLELYYPDGNNVYSNNVYSNIEKDSSNPKKEDVLSLLKPVSDYIKDTDYLIVL